MVYHQNTLLRSNFAIMLPIYRKTLYHPLFLNLHGIRASGLNIHQGLISKSAKHSKVEKRMKIIFANLGAKNKSETMLEVIRIGGWEVYQATLLKLPQNWVICIEKGSE